MKNTPIIFALVLLVSFSAFARKPHKGKHQEMRKELKAYRQTNMMPVLKAQRAKLESQLTASEKATISEVRATVEAQKEAHKEDRKEFRKAKKAGQSLTETQTAKKEAMKAARKQQMERLKPIAKKHRETIQALNQEIASQRAKWEADLQAIRAKHLSATEMQEMEARKKEREADREKRQEGKGKKKGAAKKGGKGAKVMKFLLLDPNN